MRKDARYRSEKGATVHASHIPARPDVAMVLHLIMRHLDDNVLSSRLSVKAAVRSAVVVSSARHHDKNTKERDLW